MTQVVENVPSSEIVGPAAAATASFIYPMPTWDERVYTWSLTGASQTKSAIAIASVCSTILLLIAITVIIYRRGERVHSEAFETMN